MASILPCVLGFAGPIYGATVGLLGSTLIMLALQLHRIGIFERKAARRLFVFSLLYLFVLFAMLLVDAR